MLAKKLNICIQAMEGKADDVDPNDPKAIIAKAR